MFSIRYGLIFLCCLISFTQTSLRAAVDTSGNLILGLRIKDLPQNFLLDLGSSASLNNGFSLDLSSNSLIRSVWGSSWSTNASILWNVIGSYHDLSEFEEGGFIDPSAGAFMIGNIAGQPQRPTGFPSSTLLALAAILLLFAARR